MKIVEVKKIARLHKWKFIDYQPDSSMISFGKEIGGSKARINVYYTKMTVGTSMTHPKKGKTQLFRKHVTPKFLKKLFENPRTHSEEFGTQGYYRRQNESREV